MAASAEVSRPTETHLPGEAGVWIFIIGDMLIFSLLFIVFVYYRAQDIQLFTESQRTLNQTYGVLNTLLMLSSSWFVALGINFSRQQLGQWSARLFALAAGCGLCFVVVKVFEYGEKFRVDLTIATNDFFMYYYLLTGIHLLHVMIGMGVLAFLWSTSRTVGLDEKEINLMESGASFWHMVDMLWIVLFALLYLMR